MIQKKRKIYLSDVSTLLAENFFYIINALSIIATFIISFKQGIAGSLVILIIIALNSKYIKFLFKNKALLIFQLACIFSVYAYTFNEVPISVYISAISYNVIPTLIFLFGVKTAIEHKEKVFKKIFYSNLIIMIIGLVLLFFFEQIYFGYVDTKYISVSDWNFRFGSYLSSIPFGSMCTVSVVLFFMCFRDMKLISRIASAGTIALSIILCMQRGAWITSAILLILCVLLYGKRERKIKYLIYTLFGVSIILGIVIWMLPSILDENQLAYLTYRLSVISPHMVTERLYQWENALSYIFKYPLGYGLGASGVKAARYLMQIVPDGNYLAIWIETGVIGFLSFLFINIKAIKVSLKKKNTYLICALLAFLIQAIGSNVFDPYYSSFIYWFILGYATYAGERSDIVYPATIKAKYEKSRRKFSYPFEMHLNEYQGAYKSWC